MTNEEYQARLEELERKRQQQMIDYEKIKQQIDQTLAEIRKNNPAFMEVVDLLTVIYAGEVVTL